MTGGIGFIYLLTTLLVGVFFIGQSSIILFRHPRDRVVRSYLIFAPLSTVKSHIYNIYRKVEVKSRFQFVAKVREFKKS